MTDNGSCYRSKAFKKALKAFGLRQIFTRPYTPKTNGKAERFIQTSLRDLCDGLRKLPPAPSSIGRLAAPLQLAPPPC
jgi:transposase InsO family protein